MRIGYMFVAAGLFAAVQAASAGVISQTLGDVSFADNTSVGSGSWLTADGSGDPADVSPFNGVACGADNSANCTTSWTFSDYLSQITPGDIITGATISVGIGDLDSGAPGDQVANFTVGGDDLTAALNTLAETANLANSVYKQFTVTLDASAFTQLASGTTTVDFGSQGPGLGIIVGNNPPDNGVFLDYSTLTITTETPVTTPEPATLASLLSGLAGLALFGYRRVRP